MFNVLIPTVISGLYIYIYIYMHKIHVYIHFVYSDGGANSVSVLIGDKKVHQLVS